MYLVAYAQVNESPDEECLSPDFLQGPDIWDVGIANLAMLDASKGTVSRDLLQDNDIRDMGEASLEKVDTIWT
nr:hypothetical protein BaRGS_032574 [Batillaria attramentaria]